jgi:predicted house-cleaning noncanonical NTP pyrophosphatase (MazG superfamily)
MLTFHFNKLVRDKIINHQIRDGIKPNYVRLDKDEHKLALIEKIKEELKEVEEASHETLAGEIADVQQAIDDLVAVCNLTPDVIKNHQIAKEEKNGSFKQGIYINTVDIEEDNDWAKLYRQKYEQD